MIWYIWIILIIATGAISYLWGNYRGFEAGMIECDRINREHADSGIVARNQIIKEQNISIDLLIERIRELEASK